MKAKGNPLVSVLVCNVLMTAFLEEENWPESFVKVCYVSSVMTKVRQLGGSAVRAFDMRPKGPRFNSQPVNYQVTTLGKCVHTYLPV